MSSEAQVIIDVWEAVRDHLSHGKRATIAQDILDAFVEYGFTAADCATIVDEPDLANAYDKVFTDEEEEEEDDEL